MTPGAVTPYWRPLEIELGLQYSFPADNWSLGLIVMELLTGDDWVGGLRPAVVADGHPQENPVLLFQIWLSGYLLDHSLILSGEGYR